MSWLYTIIFAGLMFSTESNLSVPQNATNYSDTNTKNIVKLDETEKFEQTYALSANGRVSVSNVNGSITIETWDNAQVKFEAIKIADSKERFSDVEIKIDSKADSFSVETNYGDNRNSWRNNGKLEVQYRLTVPRNAVLNEIETVNGSISISNAHNLTKASAVNGQVKATNLRGTANLSTVNGTVEADFDQLQTGSKISLNTVNGTVNLIIPSDANATLRADSVNGNITNDFGLPVRKGQYVGRDLYGKVGSGDVQIRLNSVNGGLSIKRKADGKNVNPATNLLQQKSEDEDWDKDDEDNNSDNESRISAQSQKQVEKELKAAEKELKAVDKEVAKINSEVAEVAEIAPIAPISTTVNVQISEETRQKIEEARLKQQEAMAKLSEANFNINSPVIERKTESFTIKGTPKVTVDAKNCAVNVRGWDKPEVKYLITKISKNRLLNPLEIKTENSDSKVEIKVTNAAVMNDLTRVVIEVFVPKKSNLRVVTNSEIRLEGVSGEIDLSGADEAINVRDSDGTLSVKTADGKIRVIGFKGEIISQTADGEMDLEGDFAKISAQTVDGKIVLTLPENANAIFNSNVEIESEGFNLIRDDEDVMRWRIGKGNAEYNLTAVDGQIFVRNANILRAN